MKHILKIGTSIAATAVLSLCGIATPAQATPAVSLQDKASTISVTGLNGACNAAVLQASIRAKQNLATDVCRETIVTSIGQSRTTTVNEISSLDSKFPTAEFASLTAAVVAGTVKSRTYSQQVNNLTDSETQAGTFYYDGTRAWVTSSYRGVVGSHRCTVNWSVGYSIALQGCYESGSSSVLTLSQQWLFTPFVNGFPVSWSETYSIRVTASGQVY
jgi:hypothetical protein